MKQRLDIITLGVPDLAAARRFYLDGMGWTATADVPGEVVFLQVGPGLLLALFGADDMHADIGDRGAYGRAPLTLAHNVASEAEVAQVLATALEAGATLVKPAQRAAFGGFHAYFEDPAGFRWEICHNPGWHVADDGTVHLGPVP